MASSLPNGCQATALAEPRGGDDINMQDDFETIGSAKKLEARIEWEKMVFEPAGVDLDKLMAYLDGLFGV